MHFSRNVFALPLALALAAAAAAAQDAASVQGVWDLKARQGQRTLDFTMNLKQEGRMVTGSITDPGGRTLTVSDASFVGDVLKLRLAADGGTFVVEGRLECERLAGTYVEPGGSKDTWEAKRRTTAVAGARETNPFTTAADAEVGRKYFLGHCGQCHGSEGEGGRGVNLATGQYRHGGSDRELFRTIQNGVPGTEMSGSGLSENEIWKIVTYIRRLAQAGAEEKAAGDVAAGRIVYQSKGACASCHMVDKQGGVLGPDLSDIGLRRSLKFLRQALVEPQAYVADNYQTATVTTRAGEQISGVRLNEDEYSIQLRDPQENLRSFLKRNLKDSKRETRSLMPAYGSTLSPPEIENLVAYLSSLRRKP